MKNVLLAIMSSVIVILYGMNLVKDVEINYMRIEIDQLQDTVIDLTEMGG